MITILCDFILQVFCEVEIKRMRLSQANADLAEAADKLEAIRKKLAVCSNPCGLFLRPFLPSIINYVDLMKQMSMSLIQTDPLGFLSIWLFQDLDSSLETLTAAFERATAEKLRFQEEVNRTNKTIELANRLVKGLEVSKASAAAEAEAEEAALDLAAAATSEASLAAAAKLLQQD